MFSLKIPFGTKVLMFAMPSLAILLAGNMTDAGAQKVWEEQDGLVIVECENAANLGYWKKSTSKSGFTGSGYLDKNGGGGGPEVYTYNTINSTNSATYHIKFNKVGYYLIKFDVNHPGEDNYNDYFVSALGGVGGDRVSQTEVDVGYEYPLLVEVDYRWRKFYDSDVSVWTWDDGHASFFHMPVTKPGTYPVQIYPRNGSSMDKMAIIHGDVPYEAWLDRANVKESPINMSSMTDKTPPAAPTNLKVEVINSTTAKATWTGVADSDLWRYVVYIDGNSFGPSFKTDMRITGLLDDMDHSITVKAKDKAGNLSAASGAVTVKMPKFADGIDGALIKKTAHAPTIDGSGNDEVWKNAVAHKISKPICGLSTHINCKPGTTPPISGESDCSGFFKALWDDSYVYYYVQVTDNMLVNKKSYSEIDKHWGMHDDGIEIMTSYNLVRNPAFHAGRTRFRFMLGENTVREIARFFTESGISPHTKDVLLRFSKPSATSYAFEVRYPHRAIMQKPVHNKLAGLDIHIADNDGTTIPKAFVAWNDTIRRFREDQAPDFGVVKYIDPQISTNASPLRRNLSRENVIISASRTGMKFVGLEGGRAQVQVFDIAGNRIISKKVSGSTVVTQPLRNGCYLVQIYTDPGLWREKIVIK